ncbi:hypothetical protein O6H91_02G075800 [Diphasiastrum complanatum]|uniref:Uncharacterized protein n=1 Tax=Diphasiastrum complanatum TaxID=34168 RepID=A0ACC2EGV6_DIPCM|nr:hypothetical protein O6H91_02G075800 [Diphasiastrum complanatum]
METATGNAAALLQLPPGFRFHPTDEELVVHYLARKATNRPFPIPIIAEVDLYKFDPWELPQKALFGEKEWYFFSPRDRKYPNGSRPNRSAASGYWKATGTDKPISSDAGVFHKVGIKKALVFYKGRAPKGVKSNWIMHEYRLIGAGSTKPANARRKSSLRLDDWVLCRIYKRSKGSHSRLLATTKMEAEEESCLEDVLASLPDIDDSKLFLPRFGSFNVPVDQDHVIDCLFTGDSSETRNRSSLVHAEPWDSRIQHHYSGDAIDLHGELKPPLKESVLSHAGDVQGPQQGPQSHWSLEPGSRLREDLYQARLLLRRNSNFTERLQNFPIPRHKGKMIVSCHVQEDEVQSTCRSPTNCHNNQHQERQHDHHRQEINVSDGLSPAGASSLTYTMQGSDLIPSHLQLSCIPKFENDSRPFPKMNGFYVQSNS